MRFEGLSATADLVGRRIRVAWAWTLDPLETPGSIPAVTVRRKEGDFEFPPPAIPDAFLVYASTSFPPAPIPNVREVTDVPPWEEVADGLRVVAAGISVADVIGGVSQEVLRRTARTTYAADGAPRRLSVELLDARALAPRTVYYYELSDGSAPANEERARYRATAAAGGTHGLNRRLYEMLPEVYKRHDVRTRPALPALPGVPEAMPTGGQLRRFVDMFGMGLDAIRSSAEQLLDLSDGPRTDARFLPPLSRMIGWEPTTAAPIPLQRNELLSATRLFDVMGTVPALRALVTYQTGWHSQVTEFAQHVVRASELPRRNLFVVEERPALPGAPWQGADDASALLQFPAAGAVGAGALPAVLASAAVEPFALRAGMEITITVDNGVPARVRFGPDDFAVIGAATASEVAAAISAAFDSLGAQAMGGTVELRTHAVGPGAALRVDAAVTSLLTPNDAPTGAVSAFADAVGRIRVFYEQRDDPDPDEQIIVPGRAGAPAASERLERSIRHKGWGYGEWHEEWRLPDWVDTPASPCAAPLGDGRIWVGWRDGATAPADGRIRYAVGRPRAATPAVITGQRAAPFALQVGAQLRLRGRFGVETFAVLAGDYVDPAHATAAEVAAAVNAQLVQVTAAVAAGGVLRLATIATGGDVELSVDLAHSTAARQLGLAAPALAGQGTWDDEIDWSGPFRGPTPFAPLADPCVVRDPLGGARVCWSEHRDGRWVLRQAHWSERLTVVSAAGVGQRQAGPWQTWHIADGLPSDDVRAVAVDANGTLWLGTPAGLASRQPDGTFAVRTIADGLSSNDVRGLALAPGGDLWLATPAGVSVRRPDGTFLVIAAAPGGLPDNDVRAVAANAAGTAWAATPVGLGERSAAGVWRTWTAADGLSAGVPRAVTVGDDGRVALATTAGVSIRRSGTWSTHTIADGLPSDDVRAAAWDVDTLVVATAAGLALWNGRAWTTVGTANGLPSADVRAVAVAPDGTLLAGTATGLASGRDSTWRVERVADGLPSDLIVGVHVGWSAAVTLASDGGGHREPRAMVDAANRTWLAWSRRAEVVAGLRDTWTLRLRRFDPAAAPWTWDAERPVTTSPGGGTADREPALEPAAAAGVRVFFSSDRHGGRGLWHVTLDAGGVPVGVPAALPDDAAESTAPAPVRGPTGRTWLFHRSDRSVAPAQSGTLPSLGAPRRRSERVPDAGALRLHAGSRTPVMAHAARNLGRRTWGDLFTYTPQYPNLVADDAPADDHLYTRRTVGLHLRQARTGQPVTEEQVRRLLQLLRRSVPINLRLVLIVSPEALVELVYTPLHDLADAFADDVPLAEVLGPLADATRALSPDMLVLLSNDLASRSASVADPTTLRRRTWFPDLA